MRSYEEIRSEQTRAVDQAIQNAERDLEQARMTLQARQQERRTVEDALHTATTHYRALDLPQSTLKTEIADLERRLGEIQRQVEAKTSQLREVAAKAEDLRQVVTRHRSAASSVDRDIARATSQVGERSAAVEDARKRRGEALARALTAYVAEVFEFVGAYATMATAREKHDKVKASFEEARHSDPAVLQWHEERIELRRLLDSAQVPAIRATLEEGLRSVERNLTGRFPGLLDAVPAGEDQEALETYFWRDEEDDLTYLIVPIPESCWRTPPGAEEDPRGRRMAQVIWGFVQMLGDPVPSIELVQGLVVLELLGDHTNRLGEKLIEINVSAGKTAAFLPVPLPTDLREALT